MGAAYWAGEYMRLLLAYGFVFFLWPLVVFGKHLRGKGAAYRFAFCATASRSFSSSRRCSSWIIDRFGAQT